MCTRRAPGRLSRTRRPARSLSARLASIAPRSRSSATLRRFACLGGSTRVMDWELPVIALRTQVVLPRTLENVDVGRPKSKRALEEAQAGDNRVVLVVQRDARIDDPSSEDLYDVGTLAIVKQVIRLPNDTLQVLVEGRAALTLGLGDGSDLGAE